MEQRRRGSSSRRDREESLSRFFTVPVVTLIASTFLLGMSEFVIVGILPDIASSLQVSEVDVGNLVALFAVVYAPLTPFGSAYIARFRRFRAHLVLMGVFLVGNVLCAFAMGYAMLVVGRVVIAVVSGTLVAVAMTYAPDVVDPPNRTRFIAWVFSGFSLAAVVGVPVGTWLAGVLDWRWPFHLIDLLTIIVMAIMALVLPRGGAAMRIGFIAQFRLFLDRRIQLGVLAVVCGAAASYTFYTYLTPIMRDEIGIPQDYVGVGLVVFGVACLISNLWSGRLAARGFGVEPLCRVRPIYLVQAVVLCLLAFAEDVPVVGGVVLVVLGIMMYLQNSSSQVLYMDVAASSHPGSTNLAASLNSMAFNIGIAAGSAVSGVVNDNGGLRWLGPAGAVFALAAAFVVSRLRRYVGSGRYVGSENHPE